jgi:transketolase
MMRDELSARLRDRILDIAVKGREGHIASSFSIVEILIAVLFDPRDASLSPAERVDGVRRRLSRFVLSKGHAALALYSVLWELGVLSEGDLDNFAEQGSRFGGHPTKSQDPPIAVSSGSLGHGLPMCAGMAYAAALGGRSDRFTCLCGDGEINEGSIWESLLLIGKFRLRNLTLIVDNNGSSTRAIDLGDIAGKLASFGMHVKVIDGHDIGALRTALDQCAALPGPAAIVANTVKGHGSAVTRMNFAWHHRVPSAQDVAEIRSGYYI